MGVVGLGTEEKVVLISGVVFCELVGEE
jgi:hypothetical protein